MGHRTIDATMRRACRFYYRALSQLPMRKLGHLSVTTEPLHDRMLTRHPRDCLHGGDAVHAKGVSARHDRYDPRSMGVETPWAAVLMSDVCTLSARELVAALRRRELRATEVLEAVLARADWLGPMLNPFSVRLDDSARVAAANADSLLDRGEGGPLCGVPLTIKDSHWLAGVESRPGRRR